jgi:glycosyltransferase involved in cell wall biosynthesis
MLRLRAPLERRGFETLAIGPHEPGNAVERLRAGGIDVTITELHRLRATPDPRVQARFLASLAPEIAYLRRFIRERGIDLVQAHGPTNPHVAIAAHLEGRAVVWHIYDTVAPMWLRRLTMPLVVRLADVITTVGEELARVHPGAVGLGERTISLLPPVDTAAFAQSPERRAAARERLGAREGDVVIGTVGNRNPSKGHGHLLRAAAVVRRRHPAAVVRIVGAPSPVHATHEAQLRELGRELGLNGARALRWIDPGDRVADHVAGFDLFAMTSVPNSEGIPTVILEAMAAGLPIVATDVGAVREVVHDGENGFVVAPLDDAAIATAIERLVADPALRARLGAAGRELTERRCALDPLADEHARAFALALEHRRQRTGAR